MIGLTPVGGTSDDTPQIQAAIDEAKTTGGAGRSSLRIWEANGTARNLRLGWSTSGKCLAQVPNGAHLDFGGTSGKLYIKTSAPTTSTDGTVVGTQT